MEELTEHREAKRSLFEIVPEQIRNARILASRVQEATDLARTQLEALVASYNEANATIIDTEIDIIDPDQVFVLTQTDEYQRKLPGEHSAIRVLGTFKGLSVFDTSELKPADWLDYNPDPRDEIPVIERVEVCAVVDPSNGSWYKDEKLILVPTNSSSGSLF